MNDEIDVTKPHDLKNCARCGGEHHSLILKKFVRPVIDEGTEKIWGYWATCPATGDPILYYSIQKVEDTNKP